ncbi:branched-chain amino acid transaminase [Aureispira anguillae]|uniref:Branched-chain-amino-acid aminotransferase n=1 Tax=Aureispira anguillae TaxID=2864201 RepID=A0A915YEF0_9BACT|nr:branched-chain amino acid transaminase [Aureispira anguillae]BDS11593.1 branched-chain amino acid transaminase [Aureispira anguillae]
MKKQEQPSLIWFNGNVEPWENATVHVWSELATRGANIFEGIRCYQQKDGSHALISLEQHLNRLFSALKILRIASPFTKEELKAGIIDLINALKLEGHIYVRPTVYVEKGRYGEGYGEVKNGAYIVAFPVERSPSIQEGIKCCVSSWRRMNDLSMSPLLKAGAAYQSFKLPMIDALNGGYDEAILLNDKGLVAETTGATIFMVRNGQVITPPISAGILESITRSNCINLLRSHFKIQVVERDIPRTELYWADEIFLTGTLAELTPVLSIDKIDIGNGAVGPITQKLQTTYLGICEGRKEDTFNWLTLL